MINIKQEIKKLPPHLARKGTALDEEEQEALQNLFGDTFLSIQDGATFGRTLAQRLGIVPKYGTNIWLYPDQKDPINVKLNSAIEVAIGLEHLSDRYKDVRTQVIETFSIFAHPLVEKALETVPLTPTAVGVELMKISPDIVKKVSNVISDEDVEVEEEEGETLPEALQKLRDFCEADPTVKSLTKVVLASVTETNLAGLSTMELIHPAIPPAMQGDYKELIKNCYTAEVNQLSNGDTQTLVDNFGYLVGGVVALEAVNTARYKVMTEAPEATPEPSLKFEARIDSYLKKTKSKLGKAILQQMKGVTPDFPNGSIENTLKYYNLDDEKEIERYLKDVETIPPVKLRSKWLVQLSSEQESDNASQACDNMGVGNPDSAHAQGASGVGSTEEGGEEKEEAMKKLGGHGYSEPDPYQAVAGKDFIDGLKEVSEIFDFEASYVTRDKEDTSARYIMEQIKALSSKPRNSREVEEIYTKDGGREVYTQFKKYCTDPRKRYKKQDSGKRVDATSLALHRFDPSQNIFKKKNLEDEGRRGMNIILDMSGSMSGEPTRHMRGILSGLQRLAKEDYLEGKLMLSLPNGTLAMKLTEITDEVICNISPSYGTEGLRDTVTEALPSLREGFNLVITDGCLTDAPINDIVSQYNLSLHGSYIANGFTDITEALKLERKLTRWFPYNTVRGTVEKWAEDIAPVLVRAKVLK